MTTSVITAARAKLEALEAAAESLSIDDVAAELEAFGWDVSSTDDPDELSVSHAWTPKGLRTFLAAQQFLELLLPSEAPLSVSEREALREQLVAIGAMREGAGSEAA